MAVANVDEGISFGINDDFKRLEVAKKVIALLAPPLSFSPVLIDGDWGTGKTIFCKKLINLLDAGLKEPEGLPDYKPKIVYLDAFSADHADNPLLSLFAAILALSPEAERDGLIRRAMPYIGITLRNALKFGTSLMLPAGANELVRSCIDEVSAQAVNDWVKDFVNSQKYLEDLQKLLGELAQDTPLLLVIDELDRCRPDYTVAMLETLKHVFGIDGVQVLMVANRKQIELTVQHQYGCNIDSSRRYLDKFINAAVRIPNVHTLVPRGREKHSNSHAYFNQLVGQDPVLKDISLCGNKYELIDSLLDTGRLGLRDVEKFVRHIRLLFHTSNMKNTFAQLHYLLKDVVILGVYLCTFEPEIADELKAGNFDAEKVARALGAGSAFSPHNYPQQYLERWPRQRIIEVLILLAVDFEKPSIGGDMLQRLKTGLSKELRSGWDTDEKLALPTLISVIDGMSLIQVRW